MDITKLATNIVERLVDSGFEAYFAGGWVRDYLLGHPRGDIDIATSASPDQVEKLFERTFAVGAQFGVILVIEKDHPFEVSSFRKDGLYVDGRRPLEVSFATAQEDVQRRDFTINGMFYNPLTKEIYDWVEGQKDLQRKMVRAIGNADHRIQEDRLRMLRAVRQACRLHFFIDPETEKAIKKFAPTLFPAVAMERVWAELKKMAAVQIGHSLAKLYDLGLLQVIFPEVASLTKEEIRHRLAIIDRMPSSAPVIVSLAELIPNFGIEQVQAFAKRLTAPKKDQKFLEKVERARELINKEMKLAVSNAEWVRFYAQEDAHLALELALCRKGDPEKKMQEHSLRAEKLGPFIARIQQARPLVSAKDLLCKGITPGPKMGALLRKSEEISINEQLNDKEQVLQRLQGSAEWMK